MTGLAQFIDLSSYLTSKLIWNGFDGKRSIDNLQNEKYVKAVLKATSKEHKEIMGILTSHILKRDLPNASANFLINMVGYNVTAKMMGAKVNNKQLAKQIIENSFITAAVYEMFDLGGDILISQSAVDTVKDISENMVNYPEAFKIFEEFYDRFNTQYNLDKLSSEEFLNQFKNKTFLQEFSSTTNAEIKKFIRAWNYRHNEELERAKQAQLKELEKQKAKEAEFEKQNQELNKKQQQIIDDVTVKKMEIYNNLKRVNAFGYSKIAGYDEEKSFLKGYLSSLSDINTCDSEDLNNSILFYGPRGNGKTTFASAIADELGCKYRTIDTTSNKEKAYSRLLKQLEKAKTTWDNEQRNSIILIDECSAFMTPAKNEKEKETNKQIAQLIKNAASKYHATLFLTTNYPMKIDKIYMNGDCISLTMPIDTPDYENAKAVFKYYINDDLIDYKKIMIKFNKMCDKYNSRYSNGQIKSMVDMAKNNNGGIISMESLLDVINSTVPEISKKDLDDYNNAKKALEE